MINKAPDKTRSRDILYKDGKSMMVYSDEIDQHPGWFDTPDINAQKKEETPELPDNQENENPEESTKTQELPPANFKAMESPELKEYVKKHFPDRGFYPNAKKEAMLIIIEEELAKIPEPEIMSGKNDNTSEDN